MQHVRTFRILARRRRRSCAAATLAAGVAVLAACSSGSSGGDKSAKLTTVTADMSFPFAASSSNCIYDYGESKGFFAKYGIDPKFDALNGTVTLINEVAAGKVDIGVGAAVSNIVQAVSKKTPVKLVAVRADRSLNAVISLDRNPIRTPADLVGKKIAYSQTTLNGLLFKLMLQANHIDEKSVTVVGLNPTAYASALNSGAIDGYVSYSNSSIPNQEKLGGKPIAMLLSDHGVDPRPSDGFVAGDSYIKNHPKQLADFLKGARDTWLYMYEHQDETAQAGTYCAKKRVGVDATLAAKQMRLMLSGHSAQMQSKAFMRIDAAGLQSQVDLLHTLGQLPDPLPASAYYTPEFLPDAK
jgi:NitT/TauT family transport system substrate-binding protein